MFQLIPEPQAWLQNPARLWRVGLEPHRVVRELLQEEKQPVPALSWE